MNPKNSEYSLSWDGHTQHVKKAFNRLLQTKELCDVTLYVEGHKLGAHKIFLSACSKYFDQLFKDFEYERPVVVLKGVRFEILKHILNFIYNGETNVEVDQLNQFLEAAAFLKIDGLIENHLKRKRKESLASEIDNVSERCEQVDTAKVIAETVEKYRQQCPSENVSSQSLESFKMRGLLPKPPKLHRIDNSSNRNKEDRSLNYPDFSKPPDIGKYPMDTPMRVGEWLSDYEFASQSSIAESKSSLNENTNDSPISKIINDPPIEGNEDSNLRNPSDFTVTNIKSESAPVGGEIEEMFDQNDFANSLDAEIEISDDGEDGSLEKQLMKTPLASVDEQGLYLCKLCGKSYVKKDSLKKHFAVHVNNTTCTVCGKVLSRRTHLLRHLSSMHGINTK